MISIRSSADLARALNGALDSDLRRLLVQRRDHLLDGGDTDLGELVHIIIAQRFDVLADLEAEAGYPLAGDEAALEWVERHPGGWLEAAVITSDDHATVLFCADCICTDPALLLALLAHA